MILVSLLFLSSLVSFIFLPQLIKSLNLSTTTPDNELSNILRWLLNFRYYLISKLLFFKYPAKVGKIDKIFVYPLKSVAYIQPTKWEIDEHGLKHDRQYMIGFWDSKGNCYQGYTLRNAPRLALVSIDYNLEENWFKFTYPKLDGSTSFFKLPCNVSKTFLETHAIGEDKEKITDLWGIKFDSINLGSDLIPQDFYDSMGLNREGTTLLYSSKGKFVKTAHPKDLEQMRKVLFHDYYPIHLISQRNVDELNQRIKDSGTKDRYVEALQFRPNVVIGGNDKIELDSWYKVLINGHLWSVVQKTPRCSIGNVRMDKGDFDKSNSVTRTLRSYRRIDPGDKNGIFLGDYAIHHDSGYFISVGDEFYLKQQKISTYLPLL
ncbi:hypothetical protein WICANDRAFT_63636 [Wickerhamomyces anomalus NRRL Y-366-8]|uniref:MOSC domain-containing protein n=1 Tax=Wickerhamomyces anomalus (strain ATCC 58044 / CBS 1984 / NCYC 433 / NRRL Y-366-8) TaxID=683960 RepID=A0A1E3P0Y5_WICAA|nr:uncharacterized protein WICANDRAFT_63636 [Wickerhamomyces anomalus NRRL Y-366-8]ODQ59139.1 hypothetical protein WICANDRAFT_63636 [Wickerhamomyces anomalus NRRL Y-366-8]